MNSKINWQFHFVEYESDSAMEQLWICYECKRNIYVEHSFVNVHTSV